MKKITLLLSIITLIFSSCSSSSDDSNTTNAQDVLPVTIVDNSPVDGVSTSNFTYNGKKIVKIISDDGFESVYTYSGNLITKIQSYLDGNLETTETLAYNSSNQLISYSDNSLFGLISESYTHNTDGTISFSRSEDGDLYSTGVITLVGNDVSKVVTNYEFDLTTTNIYTYDTKNSPFKNIVGYKWILLCGVSENQSDGCDHNILTYTDSESPFNNYTCTYTYNSLNFPTFISYSGNQGTATVTYN